MTTLHAVRGAIWMTARRMGLSLQHAREREPRLVDYLGVSAAEMTREALELAILGVRVGSLLGWPTLGTTVGVWIGAGIGLAHGLDRVGRGWHIVIKRREWEVTGVSY